MSNKYGIRDIILSSPEDGEEALVLAAIWEDNNSPLTRDELLDLNDDREFVATLLN